MKLPLSGRARRTQGQGQQPGQQRPGRAGLYPALQLMLALQTVKALQRGIEPAKLFTHGLLKQGSALRHGASSCIRMSSPRASAMKSCSVSSPMQGRAPGASAAPAASLRTSALAASVGT